MLVVAAKMTGKTNAFECRARDASAFGLARVCHLTGAVSSSWQDLSLYIYKLLIWHLPALGRWSFAFTSGLVAGLLTHVPL